MAVRQTLKLILALGLAAGLGCSKTQDTAPESRIFGSPPIIESVTVTGGQSTLNCDLTEMIQGWICANLSLTPAQYQFSPSANVFVEVTYNKIDVTARVVDPEDTPTTSDVLLATTSYENPIVQGQTPEEISLVMFDDGGTNTFLYEQKNDKGEDCEIDTSKGLCGCSHAQYNLTTDDSSKGDHIFTRGFAFITPGPGLDSSALSLASDCVARLDKRYPDPSSKFKEAGYPPIPLKVEAVDHEGNLTAWPTQPTADSAPSALVPDPLADLCALCLITSADPGSECKGRPGMIVTDPSAGWPLGPFCQNLP